MSIILTFGASLSYAQILPQNQNRNQEETKLKPYFFLAKKGDKQFLILGTYHLGISLSELPQYVIRALNSSPTLIVETVDSEGPSATTHLYQKENDMKPLKPETKLALQKRGISDVYIEKLGRPLLCLLYVLGDSLFKRSLDNEIEDVARISGKKILPLEVPEDLVKAETNITSSCDPDIIVNQMTPEQAKQLSESGQARYRSGDMEILEKNNQNQDPILFGERNKKWIQKLNSLDERRAFIAVGVGHLAGPDNLLYLLKESGYTVNRIEELPSPSQSQNPYIRLRPGIR